MLKVILLMLMLPICFGFFQTPDGLIFPDRATLYVTAIEDRQYKDYKIHCMCQSLNAFEAFSAVSEIGHHLIFLS